jgi:TolA-binding protein
VGVGVAAPTTEEVPPEPQAAQTAPAELQLARLTRPAPRTARREKPVAFEPGWLEPYFKGAILHKAVTAFRQEQWATAEAGLVKGIAKLGGGAGAADERHAARFLLALARANQSRWADAAALFQTLYREYPRLAPYHAYNAARCLLRAGRSEDALDWTNKVDEGSVLGRVPDPVPEWSAPRRDHVRGGRGAGEARRQDRRGRRGARPQRGQGGPARRG